MRKKTLQKSCIDCGDKTKAPLSSYCQKCFDKLLKDKLKNS